METSYLNTDNCNLNHLKVKKEEPNRLIPQKFAAANLELVIERLPSHFWLLFKCLVEILMWSSINFTENKLGALFFAFLDWSLNFVFQTSYSSGYRHDIDAI